MRVGELLALFKQKFQLMSLLKEKRNSKLL